MIFAEPASSPSASHAETGQRCLACGALHYPPRTICRICGARRFAAQPLSGRGIVHALLAPRVSAATCRPEWVPAWVELEEGTLVRAQLRPQDAILGLPVALVSRRERIGRRVPSIGHAFVAVAGRDTAPLVSSRSHSRPSAGARPQ
jgi:uncharacterized OB-fold protein